MVVMTEALTPLQREQAAEYVLGTLQGAQRVAFERALADNDDLYAEVVAWETRLIGLTDSIEPVVPPPHLWRAIEKAVALPAGRPEAPKTGWWQSLVVWRSLAAAALLALLAIGIPTLLQPPPAPELPPVYSLVLRDSAQQPLWMIVCDWRTRQFTVNRVAAAAPDAEKSHELWLVRKDDAAPLSLGLLQGDELHGALPDNANWRGTKALAVSLEPAGGSPTGLPTGPVLYVAPTPI